MLGITRLPQGRSPALRRWWPRRWASARTERRHEVDKIEAECRSQVESLAAAGWSTDRDPRTERAWWSTGSAPGWSRPSAATPTRWPNTLQALDGGYVPAGPSGAPPGVGPTCCPPAATSTQSTPGAALGPPMRGRWAEALAGDWSPGTWPRPARHRPPPWAWCCGARPPCAPAATTRPTLALLGVRPCWDGESGRVTGLKPLPLAELRRPQVDVTLRISGFFRDAFPHLVALLDDAVHLVAGLDESPEDNPVAAAEAADARMWGPPPGGFGSASCR